MERADGRADATADEAEESTPDKDSAADWGAVQSAVSRPESRADAEADGRPNQNVSSAAKIHPLCLVASAWISARWGKWHPWPGSGKLSERIVVLRIGVCVWRDAGGPRVLSARCGDLVAPRRRTCRSFVSGLCEYDRRRQHWRQQEAESSREFHKRILVTRSELRLRVWDSFRSDTMTGNGERTWLAHSVVRPAQRTHAATLGRSSLQHSLQCSRHLLGHFEDGDLR